MKKILKIAGIFLLVIIIGVSVVLRILGNRPAAPNDYQQTAQTGGVLEAKYMADGPCEVSVREDAVLQEFGKFIVHYPSEVETSDKKYPVIVMCNGSGTPLSKCPAVAKHYASWGFLVIGTEELYSWNAFGAEMCHRYLERWNENQKIEDTESLFYQKVDFNRVGIVGHSQGGVGVFNAITDTTRKDVYKAAVALSPTNQELAHNLMWDYDSSLIHIPIMLASGAGGGDDWVVTGEQLQEIYDSIPSGKLMMRRTDTHHGAMLYSVDGYVTAWFMWQLQDDAEAAKAFVGDNAEILTNALYQDIKSDVNLKR